MKSILIANRGEIAIRVAQAAAELGLEAVAVHTEDDASCLHVARADRAAALPGQGARGYLDIAAMVEAARNAGCDAVHPGYGFLSESPAFARALADAGLTFIGPSPDVLAQLGDKPQALALARSVGAPVNPGLPAGADAAEIAAFVEQHGPIILKAAGGGGGRGMRMVEDPGAIAEALDSAMREADAAFGNNAVFVERFVPHARHIEVQVIGDGHDAVHAWERDCTLQRRHQKIVEIAPAPGLSAETRNRLLEASVAMARAVGYRGLGTFEFLVGQDGTAAFIEANPRVQVEHTVTEAVTGIDLVQTQIRIAGGANLAELGLTQDRVPAPRGAAVQVRVNMEKLGKGGRVLPAGGTLSLYEPPGGPGVRVDGHGYAGMKASPFYDSLLAKLICHDPGGLTAALARTRRALGAFRIEGVQTNAALLRVLLDLPGIETGKTQTRQIDEDAASLAEAVAAMAPNPTPKAEPARRAGAPDDPLAVLTHGRTEGAPRAAADAPGSVLAPMQGTVLSINARPGPIARGAPLAVLDSMKMQHTIRAERGGVLERIAAQPGDTVLEGDLLAVIEPAPDGAEEILQAEEVDLDRIRPDLAELQARKALLQDDARPAAVAKRRKLGKRTARENVAAVVDPGTFVEYGDLTFAAQRFRRSVEDLQQNTPADGLITGVGTVNGEFFGADAKAAILAYDYTVLAGTQGLMNHLKKDRIIDVIRRSRLPMVFFCEGGGGRPGDVDASDMMIAGLHLTTFFHHAQLSGLVPMVGIGSGRLFAGNAALLGCCDVIIATRDTCLGMGGPAMIEGGGLGVYRPEEVGPTDVQVPNGCIDVLVEDEEEAAAVAKQYLSYFQGPVGDWTAPDARRLRHVIPENRLQVYDVRDAIDGIADMGSVLELRAGFAPGMVTALARIAGRPVGILANNPMHLSGAIDTPGSDKAARFMGLCDTFDIPLLTLVDTPGMMVGPEVEKTALVRHCSRVFLAGANMTVPVMSVILRKAYGLGAQAMAGGSFRTPLFTIGWPTAEIGAMGLEGAVKLGYRKELEAETDPAARKALFDRMVAEMYERGKGINAASVLEFDTVIDPAQTRDWIVQALQGAPAPAPRNGKKRGFVDSW